MSEIWLDDLYKALITPRPLAEWSEEDGPVLWWCIERPHTICSACGGDGNICIHSNLSDVKCEACNGEGYTEGPPQLKGEPPYVGSPNSLGFTVEGELLLRQHRQNRKRKIAMMVGGWPGYHTHWTPLPKVTTP